MTLALLAVLLLSTVAARAQAPLYLFNDNTTVRAISFRFVDTRSFTESQLLDQISLSEPTFFNRVKRLPLLSLFFSPSLYPFDPIVLQRDVVRLRQYYAQNGFLNAEVSYPASQLDTTSNTIHVIFRVEEGPPLIIQDVNFYGPSGDYAVSEFEGDMRERWIDFRDTNTFRTGERFTNFAYVRLQGQIQEWLKDYGYAFALVQGDSTVDRQNHTIDISFLVDPGPQAHISRIFVEGNESVKARVVRRELPFKVGDRFSSSKLDQGQRELFALNLFRVALIDVPPAYVPGADTTETVTADSQSTSPSRTEGNANVIGTRSDSIRTQPRDSTVQVRVRVREANLRYITARSGYARYTGVSLEGQWTHRNFFGAARTFSVNLLAETGFGATATQQRQFSRLFQASVSLRQPYILVTGLSGVLAPFIRYERNPLFQISDKPLEINAREYGLGTTLVYEFYPFRTASLQHTYSRVTQFTPQRTDTTVSSERVPYNRSVVSLSGTFGRTDNYLSPTEGFLVRPYAEVGGAVLGSEVEFYKTGSELTGYLPLTDRITLAGRLGGGLLWPLSTGHNQTDPQIEDRFDNIRLYTGGPNDLRGWAPQLAGPKFARPITGDTTVSTFTYEAVGGRRKLGGNIELRLPFPGLGSAWSTAVFLDAAYLDTGLSEDELLTLARRATGTFGAYQQVTDLTHGSLLRDVIRYGTGFGIRYETVIGFIRLDVAYKLNPDPLDLRDPEQVYNYETGRRTTRPDPSFGNRFAIHLSIGQAF